MRDDAPIPCIDLQPLHQKLRADIDAAIARVLDGGRFVLGDALAEFETAAAKYLGVRHALGVANGTDALLLALKAAGIGPGDEVITSAFSFFATVEAIVHAGAKPVFADIDAVTLTLDPDDVKHRITPRTRALLPVHLFGATADMHTLLRLAEEHDLIVIEDVAQAFGARRNGKAAGTFGLAGAFSFHPSKPLGALGDGGLLVTDDDALAERVRRLRNHGAIARHRHAEVGFNSRLDDLQAAVLGVKLRHHDTHLAVRTELAARYHALLHETALTLPPLTPGHAWAHFTVRTHDERHRDRLHGALTAARIETAAHYPRPLYRQPAVKHVVAEEPLPVTEAACARCLSLPLYEGLSEAQQQRVALVIREALGNG